MESKIYCKYFKIIREREINLYYKSFTLVLAILLLILYTTHLAVADSYEENAIKYWKNAKKLLSLNKFEEADNELTKALSFVGEDRKITLTKKVKRYCKKGRLLVPCYAYVADKYYYNANEILKKIRQRFPPKIFAVAKVINLQGKAFLDVRDRAILKIEFHNLGKSRASNLVVACVSYDARCIKVWPRSLKINEIMPGMVVTLRYNLRVICRYLNTRNVSLKISFEERFGFTPNPITMMINIVQK